MKRILKIVLLVVLSVNVFARAQMFGAKSGYLEYSLSGMEQGTKKMWFDNYGEYIRVETESMVTIDIGGQKFTEPNHKVEITSPEGRYEIDMLEKTGTIGNPIEALGFEAPEESMSNEEMDELGREMLEAMGGEIVGKDVILGKTTEIVEMMGMRIWYYKNLSLKTTGEVMGQRIEEVAIKFDENIKVDKELFVAPEGIEYTDVTAQMEMLMPDRIVMDYSIDEFKSSIRNLKVDGYMKTFVQDTGEGYIALYMKGMEDTLIIGASPMGNFESEIGTSGFGKINLDGKEAYIGSEVEDGVEAKILIVPNREKGIVESVVAISKGISEKDLKDIYKQID